MLPTIKCRGKHFPIACYFQLNIVLKQEYLRKTFYANSTLIFPTNLEISTVSEDSYRLKDIKFQVKRVRISLLTLNTN